MSAQTPVDKNSPLWLAWVEYKKSEEYTNSARWAIHPEHVEGSLWAAFVEGFNRRVPPQPAEPTGAKNYEVAELRESLIRWMKHYDRVAGENTELRQLVHDLYDEDEPCRFDHHGYCQEHGWFVSPSDDIDNQFAVCPHARAKAYFARVASHPAEPERETTEDASILRDAIVFLTNCTETPATGASPQEMAAAIGRLILRNAAHSLTPSEETKSSQRGKGQGDVRPDQDQPTDEAHRAL